MVQDNNKPKRCMYGSRNAYRGAVAAWIKFWKKWRDDRKRAKRGKPPRGAQGHRPLPRRAA